MIRPYELSKSSIYYWLAEVLKWSLPNLELSTFNINDIMIRICSWPTSIIEPDNTARIWRLACRLYNLWKGKSLSVRDGNFITNFRNNIIKKIVCRPHYKRVIASPKRQLLNDLSGLISSDILMCYFCFIPIPIC